MNIFAPIKRRMIPPKIDDFPAILVPNFFPISTPKKHKISVTVAMIRDATRARLVL